MTQKACTCIIVKSGQPAIISEPSNYLTLPTANNTKPPAQTLTQNHDLSKFSEKNKMAPRNSRAGPGYARSLLNELSSAENRSVVTAVTMFAVRNPSSSLSVFSNTEKMGKDRRENVEAKEEQAKRSARKEQRRCARISLKQKRDWKWYWTERRREEDKQDEVDREGVSLDDKRREANEWILGRCSFPPQQLERDSASSVSSSSPHHPVLPCQEKSKVGASLLISSCLYPVFKCSSPELKEQTAYL